MTSVGEAVEGETISITDGVVIWRKRIYRCALGASGVSKQKIEGDGVTPIGCFAIRYILYRSDRIPLPRTGLSVQQIAADDGWCDDPDDKFYNKRVRLPYLGRTEKLFREDNLYDLIAVLGYNDDPVIPGNGSAIFMHIAQSNYAPTAGCVALGLPDLRSILVDCGSGSRVCIDRLSAS